MSRQLLGRLCVLFGISSALWCSSILRAHAATPTSSVLIGEVNWAGSSRSSADEWLELWNRTNQPLDLTGYRISGAGGSKDMVLDGSAVIPPLSAFLVANYPASDVKSGLATDPQIVTSTISLPNDALLIKLFDADGKLVDQAGDGGIPSAGISSSTKSSMIRLQDGTWHTAVERLHIDDGVADQGTPGFCDGCGWVIVPLEITSSATTTLELPVQAPIPEIEEAAPVTTVIEIRLPDIRLAKIFPAPSGGKEWIELRIPEEAGADPLNGWSLHDASGKLATLTGGSARIELSSARLNNGGDRVELHRPDGSVAERMTYTNTPRDAYWEKNPDQTVWLLTDPNAEPPEPVVEEEPETVTVYLPSPPTIELPVASAPTPKKTAVKKPVPADLEITFDMLTKIEPNVRVAITGIVATQPGIVSKNQFVLLSADGHGLLVHGNSKQPSPTLGATVRVAGTLQLNDDGLSLRLATKDRWSEIKTTGVPQPRIVNFLTSNTEDGWSLVHVTATVGEVKNSGTTLDLGEMIAVLRAKPVSGYRLSRLKEGDTIRVKALADLRGLDPVLLIRSADDIEIVKHAALAKTSADAPKGLPDWTPFGAAGITVAITQGFKKLKQLREERRVEKLIAHATN